MKKLLASTGLVVAPLYLALPAILAPKIMILLLAILLGPFTGGINVFFAGNLVVFGIIFAGVFPGGIIQITGQPAIDSVLTVF